MTNFMSGVKFRRPNLHPLHEPSHAGRLCASFLQGNSSNASGFWNQSCTMSNVHESVFAKYERRNDVQLDFSEENPMETYEFEEEVGRLVAKKQSMQMSGRNILSVTTEDFKKIQEALEDLESEEPVVASCVLRSFKEEAYESPEEEDDDDE
ncbi:Hypothetical predicted protein [Paramuricea clavata]|uniref:Uncharacterized protein n=1 Tax=Paramuricea clavata TaxID=317549 RepID=A0A7D9HL70_PARCT|nr:Hypothetical predicted protein [Paramuricea clavata]